MATSTQLAALMQASSRAPFQAQHHPGTSWQLVLKFQTVTELGSMPDRLHCQEPSGLPVNARKYSYGKTAAVQQVGFKAAHS
jgi:hypothetical protein